MAGEATDWDWWYAGLLPEGTPEPPGRRSARELAELQTEHDRNFARACFRANEAYRRNHGEQPPRGTSARYAAERHFMERLGFGSD